MPEPHLIDEQLITRLPLPLAQAIRRALNGKNALERHLSAYCVWEASLKLLGSVSIVEYAALGNPDEALALRLQNLARPSIGHWWEFVRSLVPLLADAKVEGFEAVRNTVLGRSRDDAPRLAGLDAALVEVLEARKTAKSTVRLTELFDRLICYRNREWGHGAAGQHPTEVHERMGRAILSGVGQLFERIDMLAGRRLVYVGDVHRQASGDWLVYRYQLIGEAPRQLEALVWPESQTANLPRPQQVYLERPTADAAALPRLCALEPLVHFQPDLGRLYFLNARRGKQESEYLCYVTGDVLHHKLPAAEQREFLARVLGQPVEAAAAESWAARSVAEEPPLPVTAPERPRSIGEFELLSRLGQGGMGVVYRAWQPSLGRQVALKCMFRTGDPRAEARFAREIRALGRVEHPNLVKVFTSGAEGDQWFYAMELIEGAELSRVCEALAAKRTATVDVQAWQAAISEACSQVRSQEATLSTSQTVADANRASPAHAVAILDDDRNAAGRGRGYIERVVEIVRAIADAAHHLHEAGIVHRDIKPGNIMLSADGSQPVLTDLGLAQLADELDAKVTRTRQFVGTLRYASPEQVLSVGQVDRRTDVYSLGATLWELLTLRPIFNATDDTPTPNLMLSVQSGDPGSVRRHNPLVPRDLDAICQKCLEKDPSLRYQTARELTDDLARWLRGDPVLAQPPSLGYLTGKFVRRYRAALAVATLIVLVVLGAGVATLIGVDRGRRDALAANVRLQEQLYDNHIAVAERELTQENDIDRADQLLEECPAHLRGWEWHYLMRLRDGATPPLAEHTSGLWMADFSPDGKQVATASIDGTLKLWDTASGKVLHTIDADPSPVLPVPLPNALVDNVLSVSGIRSRPIMCVAYSPDGKQLATGSFAPKVVQPGGLFSLPQLNLHESPGVVTLWNAETRKEIRQFHGQLGVVLSVAYHPDGKQIASSSINPDNTFVVWKTEGDEVGRVIKGHTSHVHRLRYSPDGKLLAAADTAGVVKLWHAETLQVAQSFIAHPAPVIDVVFTRDGRRFATAGQDGTVRVWETDITKVTPTKLLELAGHTGSALGVAFSPDGKRIATGGFDKTVRLWDFATGQEKLTLRGHKDAVWSVTFDRDGQRLLSASFDKTARIWDATPRDFHHGPGEPHSLDRHNDRVTCVAYSADGRFLATGAWDKRICLWDAKTGAYLRTLSKHDGAVWGVAFSPDGKRLASAGWDHKAIVWDTASGEVECTFTGHTAPVHCVAFSPDGQRVVSGSWDGNVKVWETETGKIRAHCDGFVFPIMAVAFAPDGKRIASGGADRKARIWDAESGKTLQELVGHEAAVHGAAFNHDGTQLATASWDFTVKLWELGPTPKDPTRILSTLKGHTDRVHSVVFSHDSKFIASASDDKTLRVWNAQDGKIVGAPFRHRGGLWSVAYSPDSKRLATACWSKSGWVKTWVAP